MVRVGGSTTWVTDTPSDQRTQHGITLFVPDTDNDQHTVIKCLHLIYKKHIIIITINYITIQPCVIRHARKHSPVSGLYVHSRDIEYESEIVSPPSVESCHANMDCNYAFRMNDCMNRYLHDCTYSILVVFYIHHHQLYYWRINVQQVHAILKRTVSTRIFIVPTTNYTLYT